MKKQRKYIILKIIDRFLSLLIGVFSFIILLFMVQLFSLTSFKIPTNSMEPTLIPGDNILVNKISFGARIFNIFAALSKEEISIYRVPGFENIQRNDILVFNFPYPNKWDSIGFDVMKYYVKRCVALPGDSFIIKNAHYMVKNCSTLLGNVSAQNKISIIFSKKNGDKLSGIAFKSYPNDSLLNWNINNFGPLYIPKCGKVIKITRTSMLLYKQLIEWEQKKNLSFKNGKIFLDKKMITSYCFQKNYYFVTGDKVEDSQDSRYWGLLPEEYIVGKAWIIWKSADKYNNKIRWNRIFKKIK